MRADLLVVALRERGVLEALRRPPRRDRDGDRGARRDALAEEPQLDRLERGDPLVAIEHEPGRAEDLVAVPVVQQRIERTREVDQQRRVRHVPEVDDPADPAGVVHEGVVRGQVRVHGLRPEARPRRDHDRLEAVEHALHERPLRRHRGSPGRARGCGRRAGCPRASSAAGPDPRTRAAPGRAGPWSRPTRPAPRPTGRAGRSAGGRAGGRTRGRGGSRSDRRSERAATPAPRPPRRAPATGSRAAGPDPPGGRAGPPRPPCRGPPGPRRCWRACRSPSRRRPSPGAGTSGRARSRGPARPRRRPRTSGQRSRPPPPARRWVGASRGRHRTRLPRTSPLAVLPSPGDGSGRAAPRGTRPGRPARMRGRHPPTQRPRVRAPSGPQEPTTT